MKTTHLLLLWVISFTATYCQTKKAKIVMEEPVKISSDKLSLATFGAGCFWCVEAVFQDLNGVVYCKSGYSGGETKNPTYKEICTGNTGHAEVIQITYDHSKLAYKDLLEVFWQTHDPTTLNKQGNDVGTQYRSVIYYHTPEQKTEAEAYKDKLNQSNAFNKLVITEISPVTQFYEAEDYHQNYYKSNGDQPYCTYVIKPKMDKFKKVFGEKLK